MKKLSALFGLSITAAVALPQFASASIINEVESNDTIATAQNIDAFFSTGANSDIANATTIPWVSILSANANSNTTSYDYYSFSATAGSTGVFDIDYGLNSGGSFDAELVLFDSTGLTIAQNDDSSTSNGAGGSVHGFDSFLTYTFGSSGLYTIGVCEFSCGGTTGGMTGNMVDSADTYTLQVSIEDHRTSEVPVPSTALLFGLGLLGLARKLKK